MMKQNRKWMILMACVLAGALMLAGCMNTGGRVTPDMENSVQPQYTMQPGMNATNQPGISMPDVSAAFDWLTGGNTVEQKINMLSEIQQSRIVVNGSTALVGVTFANQYKGEMTQRIHDMVAGEVQAADAAIQTVAVTAEKEDVDKINEIADKLASGTPVSELEGDIDAIIRNVTTIQ